MTLLAELKRRNVIRMAGLYLVGAWLITQVAGTVLPMFEAPAWLPRSVVIVLALGFIPALAFSWVFELTPEGLKRDEDVMPGQSLAPQTARRMDRLLLVVFAVALAYFGFDKFVLAPQREAALVASTTATAQAEATRASPKAASEKSIAVLPFLNMSSDAEQEYFSDGMTEEVLNALAKVPGLAVTARTSVFSLKGEKRDVRDIAKLLGVAYVLEGSVRHAGDEVRITAQLIRADNGFHLWSETYDRKLEHVFDLQAELAGAIAKALALPLGVGGDAALANPRTSDPQAYALYLQARAAYRARGDGVKRSVALYREVLQRDPVFAPAWAGLSSSLSVLAYYEPEAEQVHAPRNLRESEDAGKRALALAPESADAHASLGKAYMQNMRWELAGEHLRRAVVLAPQYAEALLTYSDWLLTMGRFDEAMRASQEAVSLEPLVPIFLLQNARALQAVGRPLEATAQLEAAHALAPDVPGFSRSLASSYLRLGRADDAERVLATLDQDADEQHIMRAALRLLRDPGARDAMAKELAPKVMATALSAIGQGSMDFELDEIESRHGRQLGMGWVLTLRLPPPAQYRDEPRYIALLKQAGLGADGKPLPVAASSE